MQCLQAREFYLVPHGFVPLLERNTLTLVPITTDDSAPLRERLGALSAEFGARAVAIVLDTASARAELTEDVNLRAPQATQDMDEEELVAESLQHSEMLLDRVRAYAAAVEGNLRVAEPTARLAREAAEQELQLCEARFRRSQRELARRARKRQLEQQYSSNPSGSRQRHENAPLKVMIADDHRLVREALRAVLERHGVEVVGEAEHGREAVKKARELCPDVVLMDVMMPELNGVDGTRRIAQERPQTKVIAVSMHTDRRYVKAMLEAGAAGYLLKNADSQELLLALRTVSAGNKYVSPAIAGVVLEAAPPSSSRLVSSRPAGPYCGDKPLSPREREVLQLLAEGCSSKEIATRLSVSLPTVETHRRQIAEKLNLRTIAALTKYAIREGLTSLDK